MRRAFTLVEMLCVMAIVASLASILFPVLVEAKRGADKTSCAANLRSIGTATTLYAMDSDDLYPYAICRYDRADMDAVPYDLWPLAKSAPDAEDLLLPYVGSEEGFRCRADDGLMGKPERTAFSLFRSSYEMAALLKGQSTTCWRDPASQGYAHDDSPYWHALDRAEFEDHRRNLLHYDGHVKLLPVVKSVLSLGCGG